MATSSKPEIPSGKRMNLRMDQRKKSKAIPAPAENTSDKVTEISEIVAPNVKETEVPMPALTIEPASSNGDFYDSAASEAEHDDPDVVLDESHNEYEYSENAMQATAPMIREEDKSYIDKLNLEGLETPTLISLLRAGGTALIAKRDALRRQIEMVDAELDHLNTTFANIGTGQRHGMVMQQRSPGRPRGTQGGRRSPVARFIYVNPTDPNVTWSGMGKPPAWAANLKKSGELQRYRKANPAAA